MSSAPPSSRTVATRPVARPSTTQTPPSTENFFHSQARPDPLQRFALLPLRLFLGVTFAYAGLQKLADPGYLDPNSGTYLGSQLQAFASSSPIGFLIRSLAMPNTQFIGQAVIVAELGIGLLVLAGLFTRFAALAGALVSVVLFLSATWDVQPYFLGSDTIYAVAWVTMALVGDGGMFSLQALLRAKLQKARPAAGQNVSQVALDRRTLLLKAGSGLVGLVWLLAILPKGQDAAAAAATSSDPPSPPADPFRAQSSGDLNQPSPSVATEAAIAAPTVASVSPSPTIPAASSPALAVRALPTQAASPQPSPTASSSARPVAPAAVRSAPAPAPAPAGTPIGTLAQLQQAGGALSFSDRKNGQPGIVVDLGGGKVAAYSAICTHAGCSVQYSALQRLIVCPCHGAEFDPAQSSRVVRGPARRPLPGILVTAGADGTLYLPA